VNNLAWFLSYVSLTLALHHVESLVIPIGYDGNTQRNTFRLRNASTTIALAIFVSLFVLSISRSEEWPQHDIPRSTADLLFMGTMYTYAVIACAVSTFVVIQHVRHEKALPARIRLFILSIAGLLATGSFLVKDILTVLGYANPSTTVSATVSANNFPMVGAGIMWAVTLLSSRIYQLASRPLVYLGNLAALRDLHVFEPKLKYLRELIDQKYPDESQGGSREVAEESISVWDQLRSPGLYVHQIVVSFMDARHLLEEEEVRDEDVRRIFQAMDDTEMTSQREVLTSLRKLGRGLDLR